MRDLLNSVEQLSQKDPSDALGVAAQQYLQAAFQPEILNGSNDGRRIDSVVVTGMGGSALAALVAKVWLKEDLNIPFEVIRGYELPAYVGEHTLVVASSYSGNTEETVSALAQARQRGAQIGVIASGGILIDVASSQDIAYSTLPSGLQPRMAVIYNLRALIAIIEHFGLVSGKLAEIASLSDWLGEQSRQWAADVPFDDNYAKQLAESAVGKTAVFYGGALTAPLAYKWKISWNENAKNVAFWNEFPEFNHNEFMGWGSHPIEKPFAVFDLVSDKEHSQILKRFEISDRLLSGLRPKSTVIRVQGETLLAQLLWGSILADFVSIYVAILNGVDPTPVDLIERFKKELVA